MRFKALGAVAALILVSTAFATITFLRVQARGLCDRFEQPTARLPTEPCQAQSGYGNHRYLGSREFRVECERARAIDAYPSASSRWRWTTVTTMWS
jgi:hypothetical protein